MSLAPILIPYFMSGEMSHAQTVSAPPNFSLDAANAHLYRYSLLKTSRSIFTTRQFRKINFTPRLRSAQSSPHCIPANEFAFKILNLFYGILLVQFSLFGRISSLTMFSLLTELLFALAAYSVHHPTSIYLLHLLNLHLVKLHALYYDALLDFIHMLVLPWFALHSNLLHHGRPLHWYPLPHPLRIFAQRSLSGTTIWLALRPAILVLVLFPVCSSIFNIVLYYYILISYILFHIAF